MNFKQVNQSCQLSIIFLFILINSSLDWGMTVVRRILAVRMMVADCIPVGTIVTRQPDTTTAVERPKLQHTTVATTIIIRMPTSAIIVADSRLRFVRIGFGTVGWCRRMRHLAGTGVGTGSSFDKGDVNYLKYC